MIVGIGYHTKQYQQAGDILGHSKEGPEALTD